MNRNIRNALSKSFAPPAPQKKQAFLAGVHYPKASYKEVLLSQLGYVRKRVWLTATLLVFMAALCVRWESPVQNDLAALSALLPFVSLVGVVELYRSTAFRMAEMELVCKYSLETVTLMRLLVLGVVGFVVLLLFVLMAQGSDYGALRNLMYLGVPYLLCSSVSLFVVSKYREKEASYVCGAVCAMVSGCVMSLNLGYVFVYSAPYVLAWMGLFAVLLVLFLASLISFKNSQKELVCNLV